MKRYLIVQAIALSIVTFTYASLAAAVHRNINGVVVDRAPVGVKVHCPSDKALGMAEDPPESDEFYIWCVPPSNLDEEKDGGL
jgi:hypothetical protein